MKRFYKQVSVAEADGGWRVLLDGRPIKTAGGKPQIVPASALADALAREWAGQGDEIDAKALAMRDLADFALDAVASKRQATIAELLTYAETDTLCYRAEPDDPLHRRQIDVWEPLLGEAERRWDVRFARISGVIHIAQPEATLARMAKLLDSRCTFALAALRMLASLAASLVIALSALEPDAEAEALWSAANLEEDWQAQLWGEDEAAEARRQARFAAFELAMRFARLARTA